MTEAELMQLLAAITPPDDAARAAAHAHWASLAKPLGGLGALETLLEDAAALTGKAQFDFSRRVVAVLCADNGVVAQGVSQTDQSVTRTVAENLAARRTSVCMRMWTHTCIRPAASLRVLICSGRSRRWSCCTSWGKAAVRQSCRIKQSVIGKKINRRLPVYPKSSCVTVPPTAARTKVARMTGAARRRPCFSPRSTI